LPIINELDYASPREMKKTFFSWCVIGSAAACLALGCADLDRHPDVSALSPNSPPTDSVIEWGYSFDDALKIAQASHKPIMLDFFASWCAPCKLMDRYTYSTPSVVKASWAVVPVRIDIDEKPELAQQYMIRSVPSTIFLTSSGRLVSHVDGFLPPEGMLQRIEDSINAEGDTTHQY
jgi:thiol:disulfide interchange protein